MPRQMLSAPIATSISTRTALGQLALPPVPIQSNWYLKYREPRLCAFFVLGLRLLSSNTRGACGNQHPPGHAITRPAAPTNLGQSRGSGLEPGWQPCAIICMCMIKGARAHAHKWQACGLCGVCKCSKTTQSGQAKLTLWMSESPGRSTPQCLMAHVSAHPNKGIEDMQSKATIGSPGACMAKPHGLQSLTWQPRMVCASWVRGVQCTSCTRLPGRRSPF